MLLLLPKLQVELHGTARRLSVNTESQLESRMKRILEIRSAEGGDDAKLFAKDLAAAYIKLAGKLG